ncbi:MAG: AAA family ATPase, partial [Deltaproteobacteria bacterium]|nr:AAA family ATPase [Deltaproteobacteria bacterium]
MKKRSSRVWREFVLSQVSDAVAVHNGELFQVVSGCRVLGESGGAMGAWKKAFLTLGGDDSVTHSFKREEPVTIEVTTADAPVAATVSVTPTTVTLGKVSASFVPETDPTFYLEPRLKGLFEFIHTSSPAPQNVMLVGPHGCGKTETALQYAARTGKPLLVMDCAHTREGYLWWGRMHVNNGTTYFKPSDFFKAVEEGNHVILLDELNRVDSSILSPLMPLLDGRRMTHVPDTDHILKVGPGTVFFATMNEGSQYTGTSALDAAIQDRFSYRIEVSYLEKAQEVQVITARTGLDKTNASKLVELAQTVRKKAVGYGATL